MEGSFLFEVSWEVANRVGGIYTVIKTKAPVTVSEFGSRYCFIGPLSQKHSHLEVEPIEPDDPIMRRTISCMRNSCVNVVYGRWLIEGAPFVLLLDLESASGRLNEWKVNLWEVSEIPSPSNDVEMNGAIIFGYLVAWFLGEYSSQDKSRKIIAHYHEWQAAVGLVLCKKRGVRIASVFTTHATLLGRYLCAGNNDFYNNIKNFNVDLEAGRRGIYHRYCLERGAAHCSDVFTTVSHITAFEAENLLKRKPDGVLPNGLNVIKFSAVHEFQNLHAANKEKIHSFVLGHFYGHYNFNLDNTIYFFTSGRYEFRNKGVDMLIESLGRLNARLKQNNSPLTVVAFIIMPTSTNNYNVDSLKGQTVTKKIKDVITDISKDIATRIFDTVLRLQNLDSIPLLTPEESILLKRQALGLKRDSLPPVVTHNMADGHNDQILSEIRRVGLFNYPDDRVKIVYHPEFIKPDNPVLGLEYEDFVRGCHLGIFPSYYEPWGYTPAECTVLGIPSVTTNLSGFGSFIEESVERPEEYGIYIVDRRLKSVEESIVQLTDCLFRFCQKSRRQRINQRNRTERLSDLLDWKRLGIEYEKARFLALQRSQFITSNLDSLESNVSVALEAHSKIPRPRSAPPSPQPEFTELDIVKEEFFEKLKLYEQVIVQDGGESVIENVV